MSALEETLLLQIRAAGLPDPVREYRFHPTRRWRFDLCYPDRMLAIEAEGATWSGGRHTRGKGYESDCRKYNEAAERGWRVLRFTGGMIESGEALAAIERDFRGDGG